MRIHFTTEEMYRDHALIYQSAPGFHFFAALTPHGIRLKDSAYVQRIINLNEPVSRLRQEIRTDYHLHPAIRRNLLNNLRAAARA
jgi:hypothetical protein